MNSKIQVHDPRFAKQKIMRASTLAAFALLMSGCALPLVTTYGNQPDERAPGNYVMVSPYQAKQVAVSVTCR